MAVIAYPEALRATTAYLTTFIRLNDDPAQDPLTVAMFKELGGHPPHEVVITLAAMVASLIHQIATITGETVEETWTKYATAYAGSLTEGGGE